MTLPLPFFSGRTRQNRKNPTPAENKLWFEVLQDKRFAGLKFTRQKPLDKCIVDFYCAALMLAIEVDGDGHAEQVGYDRQRDSRLNQLGVEVIRYANREILTNLGGVYEDLSKQIQKRGEEPLNPPYQGDFLGLVAHKGELLSWSLATSARAGILPGKDSILPFGYRVGNVPNLSAHEPLVGEEAGG